MKRGSSAKRATSMSTILVRARVRFSLVRVSVRARARARVRVSVDVHDPEVRERLVQIVGKDNFSLAFLVDQLCFLERLEAQAGS